MFQTYLLTPLTYGLQLALSMFQTYLLTPLTYGLQLAL
jgi:hypothetical protein